MYVELLRCAGVPTPPQRVEGPPAPSAHSGTVDMAPPLLGHQSHSGRTPLCGSTFAAEPERATAKLVAATRPYAVCEVRKVPSCWLRSQAGCPLLLVGACCSVKPTSRPHTTARAFPEPTLGTWRRPRSFPRVPGSERRSRPSWARAFPTHLPPVVLAVVEVSGKKVPHRSPEESRGRENSGLERCTIPLCSAGKTRNPKGSLSLLQDWRGPCMVPSAPLETPSGLEGTIYGPLRSAGKTRNLKSSL